MTSELDYRPLGGSGLRVSEYALGTMTFGEDWGWGAGEAACAEMLERYVDAGGNFVDTANNYTDGTSERIVGSLLAEHGRDRFVLATKYTLTTRPDDPNAGGNHRKNLFQTLEGSLDRLDTDYVDLLWVHAYDGLTPIEEVMRALDDVVRQGRVHYVGVSDAPAWWVARAQTLAEERGLTPFAAMQVKYALTERTVERELLPAADALGLGVTAWGPLDGGVLTGKYLEGDGGRLDQQGRDLTDHQRRVAETVVAVADDLDCTPAQVALAWVREQGAIPILGATTPDHLEDNLGSLAVSLTDAARERLDAVSAVDLGFPTAFLSDESIRRLLFGEVGDRVRST
ncbi:aldo/keto reductase [Salinirubellus salinus]|uniref:Aldo/keto reductase n=1 Tax=Salinirubellus salinus TaxID=1364945 RepID=A0A9E7R2H1_9EURY|nr:aldo/keto reductase [Salinirubellus salinus]UWM54039.1 aldo/keto reductase [Salinirubellus salinus]